MTAIGTAVAEGRLPGRVWMYANYHCNLACTYCLTESAPKVPHRELPAEMMVDVAQQAADLGFTDLGVTGGEIFIRRDMPDVLARMAGALPVVALTNGTLFGRRLLARVEPLAELPVALQISLDRPDPQDNDAMRGPENFAKVVDAIPALVERGITVRIATTVESIEDAELDRLCALHRDLGVPDSEHVIRPIIARGRAIEHDMGVTATHADLPAELTLTADGAFWSPFGPTVRDGRPDTDLLVTRTSDPLSVPAAAMARIAAGRPPGDDARLGIR